MLRCTKVRQAMLAALIMFSIGGFAQPADNKPVVAATQPPAPVLAPASIFQPPAYNTNTPVNYVRTWDVMGAGYTIDAALTAAAAAPDGYKHIKETTQYLDGLGRLLQTVSRQSSPGANPQDLVAPVVYDEFGREVYKFMPYVSASANGTFKTNPFAEQKAFLQSQHPGEQVFYSKTNFESSPIGRPDKVFAPGNSWAGSEGASSEHSVQIKYLVNNANDDVRVWEITNTAPNLNTSNYLNQLFLYNYINIPTTTHSYPAGELSKTVTIDEHGSAVVEYKNKDGLLILRKVQVDDWPPPADYSGYGFICTYYVYDDLNRLRCVIQPKLVKDLIWSWNLPFYNANEGCFRYEYDERNRMVAKKVPGGGWTYMLYDKRDRLVFSRDANMVDKSQWMTTLYDELNRPVATGMLIYTGTHLQLKTYLDAINTIGSSMLSVSGTDAAVGTFSSGISVNGNPLPLGATFIPLTATYYDNYSWTGVTFTSQYNGKLSAGQNLHPEITPIHASNQVTNLVTGTRIRVLSNSEDLTQGAWISTINFYDDKNRAIQVQNTNYKGGIDVTTSLYDFTGKVLSSYAVHQNPAASVNMGTLSNMEYDVVGRLLKTEKKIFNYPTDVTPVLATTVSEIEYDAMGHLLTKRLGKQRDMNGNYTVTPIEILDYSYNVRGWLKGINKDYANKTGANANNRWFGIELNYDWGFGSNQFTGNIAGSKWRSRGDGEQRAYGYTYDRMNRVLGGDFSQQNGTGYMDNPIVNFDMQMGYYYGDSYDENGNILQMKQWGLDGLASNIVDDLGYQYNGYDNHLRFIQDFVDEQSNGKLGDFKNGHYLPLDEWGSYPDNNLHYQYDLNGNLVSDLNKGIYQELESDYGGFNPTRGIKYNYLNLPQLIYKHKQDNNSNPLQGTIKYIYDALGNKLEKVVDEEPSTATNNQHKITTTTYLGGNTYENNQIQFLAHEEGRFRLLAGIPVKWVADYMLKDHLGNVRTLLTDEQQQQTYPAATLEGSTSDNSSAISVEKTYYQIDASNVVSKLEALAIPDYPNNNGNPPFNNNPNSNATANSNQLYRLNANNSNAKMGLGVTLKVMAGDEVKILGKSYWKTAAGGVSGLPDPISALELLNAFVGNTPAASSKGITGSSLNNIPGISAAIGQLFGMQQQTPTQPKAYINWILFDDQFQPVMQGTNSSFSPIGVEGQLTDHRQSNNDFLTTGEISKSGFLYIYCSNESKVDVFFDNLQLIHIKGPLLEETHYYPFGLTMFGISSKITGASENRHKFVTQLLDDDLDLNYYEFRWRTHDPQIGRFLQIDPLSDQYVSNSTYAYAENKVANGIDLEGLEVFYPNQTNAVMIGKATGSKLYSDEEVHQIAQAENESNKGIDGRRKVSIISDFVPVLNLFKWGYGMYTSKDVFTGEEYTTRDKILGGIPVWGTMAKTTGSVWRLANWLERGLEIERLLGGNLPRGFKTIDKLVDGVATSIKSLDVTMSSFKKENAVYNKLKGYIDKLDNFTGYTKDGVQVSPSDYTSKAIQVAFEPGKATFAQWKQVAQAMKYAKSLNIEFQIQFIK